CSLVRCRPPHALFPYATLFRSSLVHVARLTPDLETLARMRDESGSRARARRLTQKPLVLPDSDSDSAPYSIAPRPSTRTPNAGADRKSTRLNSSHVKSSYAVFC